MDGYTLRLRDDRDDLAAPLDGAPLRPDTLGQLPDTAAVEAVTLRLGRRRFPLREIFDVEGQPGPRLVLVVPSPGLWRLAAGMAAGQLDVIGHAGDLAGTGMTGGQLRVRGTAGNALGAGMAGGLILVDGDAGDEVGGPPTTLPNPTAWRGMTGGEILVRGRLGQRAGWRQRGGLIAAGGPAEAYVGQAMLAGTILVVEGPLRQPGLEMVRGTIVTLSPPPPTAPHTALDTGPGNQPPTEHELGRHWRADARWRPIILRLLLRRLAALGQVAFPEAALGGLYRSYSGDILHGGRGELFVWLGD